MNILNIIVHKIEKDIQEKNQPAQLARIQLRDQELDRTSALVIGLVENIDTAYKQGKTFGSFNDDIDNYPTQTWVNNFLSNADDFIGLTKQIMTRLKINLEKENLATGGHLLFIYMTSQEKDLFMVAMVKDKKGLMFNEKLELLDIKELDLNKLNQAIRINITQWLGNTEKAYLSFLKKGPGDVAQYFLDTFGCTDSIPSKTSTKAVFDVAEALCESAGQSIQATKSIKDQICKYLEENPKEVLLSRISLIVDTNLPNEFEGQYLDLANSEEYQISNVFSPNKLILQSYKKIIHETSKWKIKLDKDVIGSTDSDKEIVYNPEDQTLTFKDLPPSLKAELLDALERNDDQ